MVELNGIPARIWEGHTDSGIPVHCYIARVAVATGERQEDFERELRLMSRVKNLRGLQQSAKLRMPRQEARPSTTWQCGMCGHNSPNRFRAHCQRCGAMKGYGIVTS